MANNRKTSLSLYIALLALAGLLLGLITKKLPIAFGYYFLAVNAVTFGVYAFDKAKAKNNGWRISEKTLHVLAIIGGWVGASFAQQFLRHKSIKTSFKVLYYISVLINVSLLAGLEYFGEFLFYR